MFKVLVVGVMLLLGGEAVAQEAAAPKQEFAGMMLVVGGGPLPVDVEVEINGEFVLSVTGEPPLFTSVADLIKPGLNTLQVKMLKPEQPREGSRKLELSVMRTEQNSRGRSTAGRALAEVAIPASVGTDCTESLRFWVGPPIQPATALTQQYFLFVSGPAVGLRVATVVNDTVVDDSASGNHFTEITTFLVKGKNTVRFESHPSCLVHNAREDGLHFEISTATIDDETIRQSEAPSVTLDLVRKKDPAPQTVTRTFRAR